MSVSELAALRYAPSFRRMQSRRSRVTNKVPENNYKNSYDKSHDAFNGPTTGLEDVVLNTLPSIMNVSTMKSNCDCLAEHIGIHFKKGVSVAAKAMREGVYLVYVEPAKPKIEAGKTIGLVEKAKINCLMRN